MKTMKRIMLFAILLVTSVGIAQNETKAVKKEASKVVWKGYKVTGSHEGTINIESGDLIFNNGKLTGGKFVIDMQTIASTDVEGGTKEKLDGHLKSDDFFGVDKFKTAVLTFDKVKSAGKNAYKVKGNLTIKGKTNPINFLVSVYGNKANATLKIDRTKYDVRYGSASFFNNLKDKAIYDEFDVIADLAF